MNESSLRGKEVKVGEIRFFSKPKVSHGYMRREEGAYGLFMFVS